MSLSSGDVVEVVTDLAVPGGLMLARHDGQVVLVSGAIPGERVRARIDRITRHTAWATTLDVIAPSPDRRVPPWDPACGGLSFAHIAYGRQLSLKSEVIADAFRRIAKRPLDAVVSVAPSPEEGYRLRARLHVKDGQAGFYRQGSHDLCDAGATGQLLPAAMPAVARVLADLDARRADIGAVTIAENIAATERVVHLEPRPGASLDDLGDQLQCPPDVTGITTMAGGRTVALGGIASVTDHVTDLFGQTPPDGLDGQASWSRHAASFFQGNRHLTGAMVRRVLEAADGETFVDLYAGVGLFAVALAAAGRRGLAVEGDRSSGADLDVNARPFRESLRVAHGSVEEASRLSLNPSPDVVIVDPPRTGVSPVSLRGIIAWRSPRLVYVSCDPPTLARDAGTLVAAGYRLTAIEAFDLFPNTPHVEVIAVFDRGA